ncbi:MAG: Cof-type HAD-IIB family hydrolase [Aristaeellaceae bacterium]
MMEAVAFDLDDTLLRDDRTISAYTVDVLRRAAALGVRIIPASGRARDSMRPYVEQLGCAAAYIACNGAEVYAPDHQPLYTLQLSAGEARMVAGFAAEHGCYAQVYDGDSFFYSMKGAYADAYARSSRLRGVYVGNLVQYIAQPTPKVLMMDEPARIAQLLEEGRRRFGDRLSVTCSKPHFLEVNPSKATKGNALRWLGEHFGFSMENVMAFGDSLNDLSMLTAAGHGVAMANAREDVRALVAACCPSNQEDGVARYVEQHILQEVHA